MNSQKDSRLIISDGFDVVMIKQLEAEFNQHFEIESKIDISYGVKNARYICVENENLKVAQVINKYNWLKKSIKYIYNLLPEELKLRASSAEPDYYNLYNLRPRGIFFRQLDLN